MAGTQVAAFLTKVTGSGQSSDAASADDSVLTDILVDPQQLECQASDMTMQVWTVLCMLCCVQCALCAVLCALSCVHCVLCSVLGTLCSVCCGWHAAVRAVLCMLHIVRAVKSLMPESKQHTVCSRQTNADEPAKSKLRGH